MAVQDVVVVNGTTLYDEMHGTGPSVLCIAGTMGDAGHFTQIAAQLADEFTSKSVIGPEHSCRDRVVLREVWHALDALAPPES